MYVRCRPHPFLAGHVDYYWFASEAQTDERVHIVPSGTLEIVINLCDNETRIYDRFDPARLEHYSAGVVSGAQSRYFVIEVRAHSATVGIHFRPGGASALLGVPPGTLTDEHANLETIWGARAVELRERLCAAVNVAQRFQILDGELLRRLSPAAKPRDEVRYAMRRLMETNVRVERVADDVDLSHRRLIEIFTAEVGVKPKVFGRIGRFQRALSLAKRDPLVDWPQLALNCGYFDQAHLIREFVSLAGLAPTELLQRSAAVEGHHAALARQRGSNLSKTRATRAATFGR